MFSRYIDNFDFKSRFRILKGGKISLVVSALLGSAIIASAAPTAGVVTSGNATISQSGNTTNINQSTSKASINWQNFNVNSNETVNFNQPNKNSITLNRVVGNEKSVIDGTLNANGQVWILNSNGILFNSSAKVNTSGLIATTAELSDKDFQDGNYNFKNSKSNSVVNLGTIDVSNNGYVVLASNEVRNAGTIKAIKGKVFLSGNSEYTINLNGNSIVNLIVTKGVLDAMVENSGTIVANGGEIYLTTNAVNELLKGVVNNTGIIEANSLDDVIGKVELFAHGGTANVSGSINAEGGFVETSGKDLKVAEQTKIKAKEWLIDPVSILIDSTLADTIQIALGSGDVTITTAGDASNNPSTTTKEFVGDIVSNGNIYVISDITWSTAQKLTLLADKDIYIHSNITASNSGGKLALYYNQANTSFDPVGNPWANGSLYLQGGKINLQNGDNFFTKNSNTDSGKTWTVISGKNALQNMATNDATKNYALGEDILNIGSVTPIGDATSPFKGSFDGLGHKITGMTISNTSSGEYDYTNYTLGLFGYVNNSASVIRNIGLENINIQNNSTIAQIGGLVGHLEAGNIENVYTTGSLSSVAIAYSTGDIGGLVGYAKGAISRAYSTSKVYSTYLSNAGGLVGQSDTGFSMRDVYYTPEDQIHSVVGYLTAGGLVGFMNGNGTITSAYVLGGEIVATTYAGNGARAGGAVGQMYGSGNSLNYIYSTAKAGIAGVSRGDTITTYSEGASVNYQANGLVGLISNGAGSIDYSTYDSDISGNTLSAGYFNGMFPSAGGKTTLEMTDGISLVSTLGSKFAYYDGYYPVLKSMMAPAAYVKVNSVSGGTDFTGGNGYSFISVQNGATESGTLTYTYYNPWFGNQIADLSGYAGEVLSISGTGLSLSGTAPTQQQLQQSGLKYLDGKLLIKNPVTYAFSVQSIGDKNLGDAVTLPTVTYKNTSNNSVTPSGTTTIKVYDSQNNDVTSRATAGTLGAGTYTVKAVLDDNTYMATSSTSLSFSVSQQRVGYSLSSGSTASLTYGSSFAIPTAIYSGTVNGINVTGSTSVKVYNSSNNDVTAQATAGTLPAGTYKVKAVLTDDNYYSSTSNSYATILTVNKKDLTYTTTGGTNTYGQAFTLPTPTFTGGIPTGTTSVKVYDSNNDVTSQATAGTLKPGNYIVKTTLTDNNYELANLGNTFGTLTINAKEVTGTLDSLVRTYGTAISLPTVRLSDTNVNASTSVKIYNSQNADVTSQALAGTLIAGTYTVKAENSNSNYSLVTTTGTLTINAKEVSGTLDSLVRTYGTAITLPTVTLSDTNVNASTSVKIYNSQNTDVTSQALAGTLIAGTYIVKAENSNSNYSLGTTTGTLTINPKPTMTEISFPKINQNFGQAISLDGILSDELISLGTKIVVLDATNKDVTELAKQGKIQPGKYSVKAVNDNANYSLTSNSVELTINSVLDPVTLVKTQVSEPIIPVIPTITAPKINVEVKPATQIKQDVALSLGISDTTNVSLVSQTTVGQSNQVISMSDLKPLTTTTSTESSNVSEVRVPLSQNSIVDLVNGGVTLPTGVDQQFFVVTTESNNTNSSTTTNSETNDNKKTKGTN